MNTTNQDITSEHRQANRAAAFAAAASLLLASGLFAETPAPPAEASGAGAKPPLSGHGLPPNHSVSQTLAGKVYSLKFDGSGDAWNLTYALRQQLSAENIVMTDSARKVGIPAFELRNVKLAEIAHTIEFLSEGKLRVEVLENPAGGTVWLIGTNNLTDATTSVKVRAVAAPNLFADEGALSQIEEAAEAMQLARARMATVYRGGGDFVRSARIEPLKSQKIFVVTGDEEGVVGLESLIKAAEQRLAEAAAATTAALAANGPRMRAVLAPHVFSQEQRWKKMVDATEEIQRNWYALNAELLKASGMGSSSALKMGLPWLQVEPRAEQKVFVLSGSEAAIAGAESLIRAAEQLAAEEDERLSVLDRAHRAKEAEEKAKAELKELQAAEEAARREKGAK